MDEILFDEAIEEALSSADTIEVASPYDGETETVEDTETEVVTETENPVADETVFSDDEIITAEEVQGETAEPITDTVLEDIEEEAETESEPSDTLVIEEEVVPSYIRHAQEIGTRENPIFGNGGREVLRPSLLQ